MIPINADGHFDFFGLTLTVNDSLGINAESVQELIDKIYWCQSVGIYTEKVYPINGHTAHMILEVTK